MADPDARVADTREDFENNSQVNAGDLSDAAIVHRLNRKRTFDAYQDLDLERARTVGALSLLAVKSALTTTDLLAKAAVKATQTGMTLDDQNLGPITQSMGQATEYPANRAVDVAAAGQAVNAEAVQAVVSQTFSAMLPLLTKAVADGVSQGLAASKGGS